jgi:hypothetical protein
MAAELESSPSEYRKIETGETKLSVERLFQISEVLNLPPVDLLDCISEPHHQSYQINGVGDKQTCVFF